MEIFDEETRKFLKELEDKYHPPTDDAAITKRNRLPYFEITTLRKSLFVALAMLLGIVVVLQQSYITTLT